MLLFTVSIILDGKVNCLTKAYSPWQKYECVLNQAQKWEKTIE